MTTLRIAALIDDLAASADTARVAAAHSLRWLNAIEAGYDWLVQQETIEYDTQASELRVPSATTVGKCYYANGRCRCDAYYRLNACWHRAASRLIQRSLERQAAARRTKAYKEVNELYA